MQSDNKNKEENIHICMAVYWPKHVAGYV